MAEHEAEAAGILSTTSLLRTVGRLGRPSGRGLYMFRMLAASSTAAAVTGLGAAMIGGALALGGIQWFMIGSWVGFLGSSMFFYQNQLQQAINAFDDYPELMRMHLVMNFPWEGFQRMNLQPGHRHIERSRMLQSWKYSSILASAYQTASPSIQEIQDRREQALINELSREADEAEAEADEK